MRFIWGEGPGGSKRGLLAGSILVLCFASMSCAMQSSSADGGSPVSPTAVISLCDDAVAGCPPTTSFSLSTIRDLVIKVDWYGVSPGNHAQELKVILPQGGALEASQTGFLVNPAGGNEFSSLRKVPLAGTWVTQREEIGIWSVQVSLDGAPIATQTVDMTR
ncbi:MAG TPA: hypothetical protein VMJ93_15235 [Verrucomicrobiae bacterium]|nr:hypothetical protein [Verrucomicrobiae bacterium]